MKTGYFNEDSTAYTITDMHPVRPWFNFVWNRELLAYVDQFCRGASRYRDPQGVMQTLTDEGENRLLFLRDRDTGASWAANRNFDNEPFDRFQTTVGIGHSVIRSEYRGIGCEFAFFVPSGGPRECWRVVVTNRDSSRRSISLFAYAATEIGRIIFQGANRSRYDEDAHAVIQTNAGLDKPCPLPAAYLASDRRPDAYAACARDFRGTYGHIAHPDGVANGRLPCKDRLFDVELAGALQFDLDLPPGEAETVCLFNGLAANPEAARASVKAELSAGFFARELEAVKAAFEPARAAVAIASPDAEIDAFANVWLKRQFQLGQTWGRTGCLGFRDVLQDTRAALMVDPDHSRKVVVTILGHQQAHGGAPKHWPHDANEVWKHEFRDHPSWIPDTVIGYLKETNDLAFLDQAVPYGASRDSGTVLDHMRRGMRYLFAQRGDHGLCLWGGGDWNDGINRAGIEGRGESVWLTQATVRAAKQFAGLLDRLGNRDEAGLAREHAATLTAALQAHAWDRDHFICGYNDKGGKIGSYENREGRIFMNMQTWAVLSGTAQDPAALMDVVEANLRCPYGYVLHTPCYTKADPDIGRMTSFEPGAYENGSVYCHGVAFKAAADCAVGRPDKALETIKLILPGNPRNPAYPLHVEPYAITNMYLGPTHPRAGESIYSWATGSAGWLFRIIVERMLGVRADYDGLRISPCLPSEWKEVSLRRLFRGSVYRIGIRNPAGLAAGAVQIVLDGKPCEGNLVPAPAEPGTHRVDVTVVRGAQAQETH